MKNYDYITARTIIKEGCERALERSVSWLEIDNTLITSDLSEKDREYINTDLSDYSNALEGWC